MFKMLGAAVTAVVLSCAGAAGAATQLDKFDVTAGSATVVTNSAIFPEACRTSDPCLNIGGARLESKDTFTLLQRPWDGRDDWATIMFVARNSGSGTDEMLYVGFNIDGVDYKTYFTLPSTLLWWDWQRVTIYAPGPASTGRWIMGSDGPFGPNVDGVQMVAQAIPEPSTWALMIIGFGLVGAAVRSRRGMAVLAA